MKVEELLVYGKSYCHSDHAKILLAELIGRNPLELLLHLEEVVPSEKVELYKKEIQAIKEGRPLQYVLGYVNFFGLRFFINENVLIPRFETEELVDYTIKYAKKYFNYPVDIIDLGCGSGVIGLTLEQKISTKTVDLIDISEKALEVAHKNCGNLNSKANLIQDNFLEHNQKKYDIIISNPPYIRSDEVIEDIVKDNEPHIALYAGTDGLNSYREIINKLPLHMKNKCLVAFEIGCNQSIELTKIIKETLPFVKIKVQKDMAGKERMLFIFKNCE